MGKGRKKIIIGVPSATGTVPLDWSMNAAAIMVQLVVKGYEVIPIGVPKSFVADARNAIAKEAVKMDCDWVFFLDDDTYITPKGVLDLIELDKDIASPPVADRRGGIHLNIFDEYLHKMNALEETQKVTAIGCATMLIKRKVLDTLLAEYDTPFEFQIGRNEKGEKTPISEDVGFCLRAAKFGFETWAVKGIKTDHLGDPVKYTYDE